MKRCLNEAQIYAAMTAAAVAVVVVHPDVPSHGVVMIAMIGATMMIGFSVFKVWWIRSKQKFRLPETMVWDSGLRQIDMPPPAYDEYDLL